ncbi:MAG: Lrp/AsnC family transcriptional regulator [Caulobacteraceae bacterium]
MRPSFKLDAVDKRILERLQVDARLPMPLLAEAVGLSPPACYRRVRRLREAGKIVREVAVVAPRTLGWALSMIVLISLEREGADTADALMRALEAEPAVIEAWQITGEHDFAAKIVARDMEDYDALTRRLFVRNDHVRTFTTLVVFRQTRKPTSIPIAPDAD